MMTDIHRTVPVTRRPFIFVVWFTTGCVDCVGLWRGVYYHLSQI